MPKLAWLTDIHLDFVDRDKLSKLLDDIKAVKADAVLISGDIAVAPTLEQLLKGLELQLQLPIYFVLGNHDYYEGSIAKVRSMVDDLCKQSSNLHFLTTSSVIPLSESSCILGHDGWADGRLGDFSTSDVIMNDYLLITEFIRAGFYSRSPNAKFKRLTQMQALADEAVVHIEKCVREAAGKFQNIVVLTHFPPYREACLYKGLFSNDLFLPHFANKILGDKLKELATEFSGVKFQVLCGHTHGAAELRVLPNLKVCTGGADYGKPVVQQVLDLP